MEDFSSYASDSHFDWDYCFDAIGEPEGGFSRRGSCCSPVCLQDIGQFLQPSALRIFQPSFDDLEQSLVRHFHLTIGLWVTWGRELVLDP